jgi:peroxiredoxin Q/BCP
MLKTGDTVSLKDFAGLHGKFKKAKAVVLGVSKDSVASHQKFRDKHGLPFPLLADIEGKACEAYGVWKEKSMYGRKYMGIERSTFVIGPTGKIEKIYPKVKVPGHAKAILDELKG